MKPLGELNPVELQQLAKARGDELLRTAAREAGLRKKTRRLCALVLQLRAQRNVARKTNARLEAVIARVRAESDAVLSDLRVELAKVTRRASRAQEQRE